MAILPKGAWILVADGEKALFLENTGTAAAPVLTLHEKLEQELLPAHEMGSDRPGRMPDPGPGQMSALEQTDLHRQAKERFAVQIADRMNSLLDNAAGHGVVVAAPPQVLSVLRGRLSPAVTAALIAELPKTLTQHPLDRIAQHVTRDIDAL